MGWNTNRDNMAIEFTMKNILERMNDACETFWSKTMRYEPLIFTVSTIICLSLLIVSILGIFGVIQ